MQAGGKIRASIDLYWYSMLKLYYFGDVTKTAKKFDETGTRQYFLVTFGKCNLRQGS